MECPVCDDVNLAISSREGVEIDYCPQCRGVWLDRGELDKIIDRVNGAPAAPPPPPPPSGSAPPPPPQERYDDRRHDRYDDGSYRKKRRGSFLEDLFDFD